MNLSFVLKEILYNPNLEAKLQVIPKEVNYDRYCAQETGNPGRDCKITFSNKQLKFPKGNFHEIQKRAIAIHSFANHELLAIEVMAATLLKFPPKTDLEQRLQKGIVQALREEQAHFKLYKSRLNELGYEFGDFPLNDFFWKYFLKIDSIEQYLSTMALTFEAANLDFASYYEKIFREADDTKTADILQVVLEDEVKHVALGARYLNLWKGDKSLWDYYQSCLPYPMTAARAKGKVFFPGPRIKAKLDEDFISNVANYQDEFKVTTRKEWK